MILEALPVVAELVEALFVDVADATNSQHFAPLTEG